jgi:hypothetical protein
VGIISQMNIRHWTGRGTAAEQRDEWPVARRLYGNRALSKAGLRMMKGPTRRRTWQNSAPAGPPVPAEGLFSHFAPLPHFDRTWVSRGHSAQRNLDNHVSGPPSRVHKGGHACRAGSAARSGFDAFAPALPALDRRASFDGGDPVRSPQSSLGCFVAPASTPAFLASLPDIDPPDVPWST